LNIENSDSIRVSPIKSNIEIFKKYYSSKKEAEERLYQLCFSLKNIKGKILIYP